MSKDWIADVAAFHRACDMPIREAPSMPGQKRVDLRCALILEEADEFYSACYHGSIEDSADALADLIYVAIGAALEFGIPLRAVWDEVQDANMAKVDPETGKVRRREDGKILKPEGWRPPDIAAALDGVFDHDSCPECAEYRAELEEQDLTISQLQKERDALRAGKTVTPVPEERAGRFSR